MTADAPLPTRWDLETLDVRLVERWLAARAATAAPAAGPPVRRRTRRAWFDTPRRHLLRAGFRVCVVRRGRKSAAEWAPVAGGGTARTFSETIAAADPAAVARSDGPVGTRVRSLCGRSRLRALAEAAVTEIRRDLLDGESVVGVLVLEDAAVPLGEGHRRVRIARVRVEAATGADPSRAAAFAAELAAATGARNAEATLFDAVLAARGVRRREPPGFGAVEVTPASTLGDVAFAVLRRQFAAYVATEPGTRLGDDPEELHDMRVATRRMRAAMSLFRAALPHRAERLREELKWIAGALGEVRDLDVQGEQLSAWAAQDPRLAPLGPAADERDAARRRMLDVLDSGRCRRFVREFAAMLRRGPPRRNAAASAPATAVAPDLIAGRRRKVRRAARRLTPESPPAAYHELRIRMKRLRYALEFLSEVYGAPAKDLAVRIAAVQDVLGRHQDAYVAIERIEAMLSGAEALPVATAFAMGVVVERCTQSAAQLRAEFPRVYARTTGRPWRRMKRTMQRLVPAEPDPPDAALAPTDPPATNPEPPAAAPPAPPPA